MKLSIIIPIRMGNPQREKIFVDQLFCLHQQTKEFELILVEQTLPEKSNENKNKLQKIIQFFPHKHIQLISNSPNFNKSWCMNVGARSAQNEYLVFLDADMLFEKDYFAKIENYIETTQNKIMVCWGTIVTLPGRDNPFIRHIRSDVLHTLGGVWCCEKTFYFDTLGGMNENFWGYGGEDNEAYERACLVTGKGLTQFNFLNCVLTHPYHDWEPPNSMARDNYMLCKNNRQTIIDRLKAANIGKLDSPTQIDMSDLV